MGGVLMTSCKGKKHSVREMREGKGLLTSKPRGEIMVQRLFYENKRPNISIPQGTTMGAAGQMVAVEQAVYTNPDNYTSLFESETLDSNKTYGLNEVVVEARSRFTPERNGKVDVDFLVRIPKEIIDKNWMIKLEPFVIGQDSVEYLEPLVVKGQEFALKQKLDNEAFEDYLNTIVPRQLYNKVFLDHGLIEQDIKQRQSFYYDEYHKDWHLHKEYESWISKEEGKRAETKAKLKGEIAEMKNGYMRQFLVQAVQESARGIDTTGLAAAYDVEFLKKSQNLRKRLDDLEASELEIPARYKDIHESKLRSRDLENLSMTSQDTLNIAKTRYMFDAIMQNEMKEERIDAVKKEMVPFPYEENVRIDTTLVENQNFVYYYKQELPVAPGMNAIKIAMKSEVWGIDESKFTMRSADTLSYFIASIAQLVDTTLLHKETVKNRNAVHRMTAYFQYRPNTWRFDPKYKGNRQELERIAKDYETINGSKSYAVDSMLLQMSTSLDGEFHKNADLSMKRVEDFKKFIMKNNKEVASRGNDFIRTNYIGEDWNMLARLIRSRSDISNKDAILEILANAANPDKAKDEIKVFAADYKIIKDSIYPKLDKVDMLFYVHRTDMTSDQEIIKVDPAYIEGVRLLQNRQYDEALEILANYPDYNTAVCLAALGYNGKAYEVLSKLQPTGNTEYLSAIVAWRMKQGETAGKHLIKALDLDPSKMYRIELDPDIVELLKDRNLGGAVKDTTDTTNNPAEVEESAQETPEEGGKVEE